MNYYCVSVKIAAIGMRKERTETVMFKSAFAANYMARQYFCCEDVTGVDIVDMTTGEVVYYHYKNGDVEYNAEG